MPLSEEGQKAAAVPSVTGSQGQCLLSVWMGGEHLLRGRGGGGTHTGKTQALDLLPDLQASGVGGMGKVCTPYPDRNGGVQLHNHHPLPPQSSTDQAPTRELQERTQAVPTFRVTPPLLLRVLPGSAKAAPPGPSPPSRGPPHNPSSLASPSPPPPLSVCPQLLLSHHCSPWPGLGGESSRGKGLPKVGARLTSSESEEGECQSQTGQQTAPCPPSPLGPIPPGQGLTPEGTGEGHGQEEEAG